MNQIILLIVLFLNCGKMVVEVKDSGRKGGIMEFHESETIELKEIFTPDLKKEVVALVNTQGGLIYIGVKNSGEIVGLNKPDDVMLQITNSLRDGIRPDVSMFINIVLLNENNKLFIRLTVNQGTKKPYYLTEKGLKPTGVYIRSGSSSAPASEDAIRMMIKKTDGDSFENNRSLIQELTFNELNEEFKKRKIEFNKVHMKNMGIISMDDIYTNLGLLVSDQCKHSIKFAIFQGTDKTIFKDRKELNGSLFAQLNEAYSTIDFYNSTRATFQDLIRIDERDFPEDAVREALLNALVHRDYSFSGSTYINLYADRLEFISLGGIVPGLSFEAIMLGASQPRNEKLAALFYRMKLIEAYGTGISKIISSYKGQFFQPKFEHVEGAFRVILPNIHSLILREENERYSSILTLFERQKEVTRVDVENTLDTGTTNAVNILNEMIDRNLISKIGSGRMTRYRKKLR